MWDGESITTSFTPGSRGALQVLSLGNWRDYLGSQKRSRSLECLEVTFGTIEVDEFGQRRIYDSELKGSFSKGKSGSQQGWRKNGRTEM